MEQHDRALARYVDEVRADPTTVGVVVVGSVARGSEREDSDVDVYLVVDDEVFDAALDAGRLAWTESHDEDYPGGYLDVKLAGPRMLARAAESGDDAMRASFEGARIAYGRGNAERELSAAMHAMTSMPDEAWAGRVRANLAQARIHGGYFLPQAEARRDPFLLLHAATHLSLAAARVALAERRTLFRGPKYVADTLARLDLPGGVFERWRELVERPGVDAGARLLASLEEWVGSALPPDETLSDFIRDNELAWLRGAAPPEYG